MLGYNTTLSVPYDQITEIQRKNGKITVHMLACKFTFHKCKNDAVIFDLMQQKLAQKVEK